MNITSKTMHKRVRKTHAERLAQEFPLYADCLYMLNAHTGESHAPVTINDIETKLYADVVLQPETTKEELGKVRNILCKNGFYSEVVPEQGPFLQKGQSLRICWDNEVLVKAA